jgi:hypothetical protein
LLTKQTNKIIMKVFLSLISIIISIGFCCHCFGQTNRDSAAARSIIIIQSKLGLSDNQVRAISLLMQKQNEQLDGLQQNRSLKIDERGKELVKIQNGYEQQLKGILNKGQWKEYKEIESANRESVLNSLKAGKIEVKELPRNAD